MTANNDGVWGELTSLKIIIKPAPWLSNWAIVAYILLVLLILYALIRYYNYQRKLKMYYYLEEREREQKEEYLYLFPEGKEAARTYLAKDHRRSRPPRHGAPLFLPIR